MDPQRFGEVTAMPKLKNNKPNQRYQHPMIIEHLANQYVLGTLTSKVHNRVTQIALTNDILRDTIQKWEARLAALDQHTAELPAYASSWDEIIKKLDAPLTEALKTSKVDPVKSGADFLKYEDKHVNIKTPNTKTSLFDRVTKKINGWLSTPSYRYASAFSLVLLTVLTLLMNPLNDTENQSDQLSYIAVLTQKDGGAHIVASTYGDSQKLIVNIINTPSIDTQESLELWVVSKTDQQARSLGVLPTNKTLLEQQLTNAQWRLIKDSESLIITVEEAGGSAIGEPSEVIVSRGLCVRLEEWNKNA